MSDYEIKEAIAALGPAGITHKRKVRRREFFRRNVFCATEKKTQKNQSKNVREMELMWLSCLALRPHGTERPEGRMSQVDGAAGSVNTSKHTHANTHAEMLRRVWDGSA